MACISRNEISRITSYMLMTALGVWQTKKTRTIAKRSAAIVESLLLIIFRQISSHIENTFTAIFTDLKNEYKRTASDKYRGWLALLTNTLARTFLIDLGCSVFSFTNDACCCYNGMICLQSYQEVFCVILGSTILQYPKLQNLQPLFLSKVFFKFH